MGIPACISNAVTASHSLTTPTAQVNPCPLLQSPPPPLSPPPPQVSRGAEDLKDKVSETGSKAQSNTDSAAKDSEGILNKVRGRD